MQVSFESMRQLSDPGHEQWKAFFEYLSGCICWPKFCCPHRGCELTVFLADDAGNRLDEYVRAFGHLDFTVVFPNVMDGKTACRGSFLDHAGQTPSGWDCHAHQRPIPEFSDEVIAFGRTTLFPFIHDGYDEFVTSSFNRDLLEVCVDNPHRETLKHVSLGLEQSGWFDKRTGDSEVLTLTDDAVGEDKAESASGSALVGSCLEELFNSERKRIWAHLCGLREKLYPTGNAG